MRALFIALLCTPVFAQTGATSLPPTGPKPQTVSIPAAPQYGLPVPTPDAPGSVQYLFTANGQCVWWYVWKADQDVNVNPLRVYCGVVSQMPNVGGRLNTIRAAADPLYSLQTLPKRITMSTLSCKGLVCSSPDPALGPIVADLNAARAK